VLIIEDDVRNGGVFVDMLRRNGYKDTVHVLTGLDGIETARNNRFDIILIDFDLPDVYGTHVGLALNWLIRRGKVAQAPLVALTAQSRAASEAEAVRLGFSAYIGKPCLEPDLVGVVRQLTEQGTELR
jgi:CheY-like chemotaxis protein